MITTAITAKVATAAIVLQSTGIFGWVNDKTSQAELAIGGILVVVGLIVGLLIAWRGKNVGSVVMGIVVGGLIAGLPFLITFFAGRTQQEVNAAGIEMITYAQAALTARA